MESNGSGGRKEGGDGDSCSNGGGSVAEEMVAMTLLVAEVSITATVVRGVTTRDAEPMGAALTVAVVLTLTTVVAAA